MKFTSELVFNIFFIQHFSSLKIKLRVNWRDSIIYGKCGQDVLAVSINMGIKRQIKYHL